MPESIVGQDRGNKVGLWLVKTGNRVLGPFSTAEIIEKIRSKEVVVIDEIISPESRWRYVRDEPTFTSVVEEIRQKMMATREDTELQTTTRTLTEITNDPSTDPCIDKNATSEDQAGKEIEAEFYEEPTLNTIEAEVLDHSMKKFALVAEHQEQELRRHRYYWPWVGAVLAGMLIVYAGFYFRKKETEVRTSFVAPEFSLSQVFEMANEAWNVGELNEAYDLYRQVDQLDPNRPLVIIRLAILRSKIEGQTLEAKRSLSDLLASHRLDEYSELKNQATLGLALTETLGEDYLAAKGRLEKAKDLVDYNKNYRLSLSIVESRLGHIDQSIKLLDRGVANGKDSYELYTLGKLLKSKGGQSDRAVKMFEKVSRRFADYRQEALVQLADLEQNSDARESALIHVRAAFDTDPEQTGDHKDNPYLADSVESEWKELLPICRQLDESLKAPVARALLAVCLVKNKLFEESQSVLNEALNKNSDDPLLHAANSYRLLSIQREADAKAETFLSEKAGGALLAQFVRARICQKAEDDACEEAEWKKIQNEVPPPLASLVGLARIESRKGRLEEAERLMESVEKMSATYIPVLKYKGERSHP